MEFTAGLEHSKIPLSLRAASAYKQVIYALCLTALLDINCSNITARFCAVRVLQFLRNEYNSGTFVNLGCSSKISDDVALADLYHV